MAVPSAFSLSFLCTKILYFSIFNSTKSEYVIWFGIFAGFRNINHEVIHEYFKFFELSDNGFTTTGMYAQSVIHVSVDLAEVKEYVKEILGMNPDEIPVDPEKALEGYVIRTREIKY